MKSLIIFIVIILLVLGLREFWCWYWKINDRNKLLKEQVKEQKKTNELLKNLKKDDNKEINSKK